jgi:hypothetical protein
MFLRVLLAGISAGKPNVLRFLAIAENGRQLARILNSTYVFLREGEAAPRYEDAWFRPALRRIGVRRSGQPLSGAL